MINNSDIIVFDFETGGLDPTHHEAVSLAGKAYNARTLEPYPIEQGGEFYSLMKPLYPDRLQDEALKVNNLTKDELDKAPDQKIVWNQFITWVKKYNPKGTQYTAPIGAGKNIRSFDMKFVEVLNLLHSKSKEKTVLFSNYRYIDLQDFLFYWFENSNDFKNEKMDTLREYFNLKGQQAHSAIGDVRDTGELIMRFLKLHRTLKNSVRFKP